MEGIMNREVFFGLLRDLPPGDLLEIQRAYWLAKEAHRTQLRDGGERYFTHPRGVAVGLITRGHLSKKEIILALLHDVVEDTYTPSDAIVCLFGQEVWKNLVLLSKYIPVFDPVTGTVIGRFEKNEDDYYKALAEAPYEVRLVKCSDRLYNLLSMREGWPIERQRRYATKTIRTMVPIAKETDAWFAAEIESICKKVLATRSVH